MGPRHRRPHPAPFSARGPPALVSQPGPANSQHHSRRRRRWCLASHCLLPAGTDKRHKPGLCLTHPTPTPTHPVPSLSPTLPDQAHPPPSVQRLTRLTRPSQSFVRHSLRHAAYMRTTASASDTQPAIRIGLRRSRPYIRKRTLAPRQLGARAASKHWNYRTAATRSSLQAHTHAHAQKGLKAWPVRPCTRRQQSRAGLRRRQEDSMALKPR